MKKLAANMQRVASEFGYQPPYRLGHPTEEELDEVWANPEYVRGHWQNIRVDEQGRVLADCVIQNPKELAAVDRGERRSLSVDLIHEYNLNGEVIGPFLKAADAVDSPACLTASFLAAHENGEEFEAVHNPDEGGADMSGAMEKMLAFFGVGEDDSDKDVEAKVSGKVAELAAVEEEEDADDDADTGTDTPDPNYKKLEDELQASNEALAAERKAREASDAKLAKHLAQELDREADDALAELRKEGYITGAQEEAYRPMARRLAQQADDKLGDGDEAQSPLAAFLAATREGGPIVQLGRETTTVDPDEKTAHDAKVARMAEAGGAKVETTD